MSFLITSSYKYKDVKVIDHHSLVNLELTVASYLGTAANVNMCGAGSETSVCSYLDLAFGMILTVPNFTCYHICMCGRGDHTSTLPCVCVRMYVHYSLSVTATVWLRTLICSWQTL